MTAPALLQTNKAQISELEPENQAISYKAENWARYFSDDVDFNSLSEDFPQQLTRGNLFKMGESIQQGYDWSELRRFFIAIMVWGFGKTGYGTYRTHCMVNDPNFQKTVQSAFECIHVGDVEQAYNLFLLNRCGSAFFTKFFYFAGKEGDAAPKPLILDAVVARSLEVRCGLNISRYAKVNRHSNNQKNVAKGIVGQISSVNRDAKRYINFLQDMADWAAELEVSVDQIELFLFS